MIDNLELDFANIPNAAAIFQAEDLESLLCDNESLLWNSNANYDTFESNSGGVSEWLDTVFNDGLLNGVNSNRIDEEAKEDFNRVLDEWKIHLEELKTDRGGGGGPPLELEDAILLENATLLDIHGSTDDDNDGILGPNSIKEEVETKDEEENDLNGNDFALEAFDLSSLLEKFEATEGCDPAVSPRELPKHLCVHKEAKKTKYREMTVTKGHRRDLDDFKVRSKLSSTLKTKLNRKKSSKASDGPACRHVLPFAQLPHFSIILRRDRVSVLDDVPPLPMNSKTTMQSHVMTMALQEHDYCSSFCRTNKKWEQNEANVALGTPDVFAGREMRSVLRPQLTDIKKPVVKDDTTLLYSKLPEYYTELAPQQNATSAASLQDCSAVENSSVDDNCFDKLPLYITGITANKECSISADTPLSPTVASVPHPPVLLANNAAPTTAAAVVSNDLVTVRSTLNELDKRKARQRDEGYYYDVCLPDLHRDDSRDGNENIISQGQRSRTKRYVSSRSPSNSDSSSRSRSRSQSSSSSLSRSQSPSSSQGGSKKFDRNLKRNHRSNRHRRKKLKEDLVKEKEQKTEEEMKKQIEDRRVVHVGNIKQGTTHAELRRHFGVFGPIEKLTLHHREHGDWYAFITFLYKVDAFQALEHGNDDPKLPKYELSLGGRRLFCLENYSDLDSTATNYNARKSSVRNCGSGDTFDFDALLNAAKSKLKS